MSNCVSYYISINDYVEKLKDKIKQIDSDRLKSFYNNLLNTINEILESNPSYDFKLNSLSNLDCFMFSKYLDENIKIGFDFGKVTLFFENDCFTLCIIFEENGLLNFHLSNKQGNKRLSGNYELDYEYLNCFDDLFEWFDEK
jgi:hypothetical protein